MSSPVHSFLFSPPPSPPQRSADAPSVNRHFTSLRSLLPPDVLSHHHTHDGQGLLKPRSPRTPQQSKFNFDSAPAFPSRRSDTDATPRATARHQTPRRAYVERTIASPPYLPTNVPSAPLPALPRTLPRPVLRLLLLVSLVVSSTLLLVFVPAARLPSLRAATLSRRLALDADGHAYVAFDSEAGSYVPPQVRTSRIDRRLREAAAATRATPFEAGFAASAPAPEKAIRPVPVARPLPPTHELTALQNYVLASAYNVLPAEVDGKSPLDAHAVLGVASHRLGDIGSAAEQTWLDELAREQAEEVTIWYGFEDTTTPPHYLLDVLHELHGAERHPTLVALHDRSDRDAIRAIFSRYALDLAAAPVLFIGNEPVLATRDAVAELQSTGELRAMLRQAGWLTEGKRAQRKLKQAAVKRHVEPAPQDAS